jgi:hypothetical protein
MTYSLPHFLIPGKRAPGTLRIRGLLGPGVSKDKRRREKVMSLAGIVTRFFGHVACRLVIIGY